MTPTAEPRVVTARVPGKINLQLRVGPRREDGYHEIATVFQAVGIYDEVTVTPADRFSVRVIGDEAHKVPQDSSNLAVQAAKKLARSAKITEKVAITIVKQIPVAGGMAGGSADAAATLVACDHLWGLGMGKDELEPIAARLGSDVPFLLHGGTAIGSHRGERLAPVLARGELHWVLWTSNDTGLSTPQVYAEFDSLHEGEQVPPPEVGEDLLAALRTMQTTEVAAAIKNDLQPAAVSLYPELAEVLTAGTSLGAKAAIVSGSGPTIAFLVDSPADGIDLSLGLVARGPLGGVHRVVGPVVGAQVIQQIAGEKSH